MSTRPVLLMRILLTLSICAANWCSPLFARQDGSERFELHGKVINSATGEPVAGALIQIADQASVFTDADGSFTFSELPRGRQFVRARKPGFFNDQELGSLSIGDTSFDVSSDAPIVVKLTPEGVIYGEVKDADSEPLGGVTVRTERWQMNNGIRQLVPDHQATTDDQGNFRLEELVPGKYFVSFLPADPGRIQLGLSKKSRQEEGYGQQFYPGVTQAAVARSFQIRGGEQVHITHTYLRQRLFQVSGTVHGAPANAIFNIAVMNSGGDSLQNNLHIVPKTGEFQIRGIPPGIYWITATLQRRWDNDQAESSPPPTASLTVDVTGDLSGVVLTLGTGVSLGVQLRDEVSAPTSEPRRVFLHLMPKDFAQAGPALIFPPPLQDRGAPSQFSNLAPGTYTVEAEAPQGYVAALRCGSVDLLREDLVIAPGAAPPPIDVTLRDDFALLTMKLNQKGRSAGIVIYSQEYPRRSVLVAFQADADSVTKPSLPPGTYHVIALNNAADLEYRNPAAVAPFLGRAVSVSLEARDHPTVSLDVQEFAERPK
jgi:hypothetical protein